MHNGPDGARRRQSLLANLLRKRAFTTQEDIVDALRKNGLEVNQASVSRDLRALGAVKMKGRYVTARDLTPGAGAPAERGGAFRSELITRTDVAGANLIVVRTPIGAASVVAARIDALGLEEIVGSLAGDDTIFLAVRSRAAQGRVLARLRVWDGGETPAPAKGSG